MAEGPEIHLIENSQVFKPNNAFENVIEYSIKKRYFKYGFPQTTYDVRIEITDNELETNDSIFYGFNKFYDFLTFEEKSQLIYQPDYDLRFHCVYTMSPDTVSHVRGYYTILDLLGDIGALVDTFQLIGDLLVGPIIGHALQIFLVSNIFWRSKQQEVDPKQQKAGDAEMKGPSHVMPDPSSEANQKEGRSLTRLQTSVCESRFKAITSACSSGKTRAQRFLERGAKKVAYELDIVRFIRKQIQMEEAL